MLIYIYIYFIQCEEIKLNLITRHILYLQIYLQNVKPSEIYT